jgi:hypothetical protein
MWDAAPGRKVPRATRRCRRSGGWIVADGFVGCRGCAFGRCRGTLPPLLLALAQVLAQGGCRPGLAGSCRIGRPPVRLPVHLRHPQSPHRLIACATGGAMASTTRVAALAVSGCRSRFALDASSRHSSGVERTLGKGEVECSNHSGGTITPADTSPSRATFFATIRRKSGGACPSARATIAISPSRSDHQGMRQ